MSVPKRIFAVWLGTNPLSDARKKALNDLAGLGLSMEFVTESNLQDWLVPGSPLPHAYSLLTSIQKADYLRCYLMHHHGGGYSDVKSPTGPWLPTFEILNDSEYLCAGYPEFWWGVADFGSREGHPLSRPFRKEWWNFRYLQINYKKLIGNCCFVFKPNSSLTSEWFAKETLALESFENALTQRPARYPREKKGDIEHGELCDYPVPWSALGGSIMQPVILKHYRRVLRSLPPPDITNYL